MSNEFSEYFYTENSENPHFYEGFDAKMIT